MPSTVMYNFVSIFHPMTGYTTFVIYRESPTEERGGERKREKGKKL